MSLDQNSRNECFDACNGKDQNDETKTGKKEKGIKHSMMEKTFETFGEKSRPVNVSLSSSLKTVVVETEKGTNSIDQTDNNEIFDACSEKDTFFCNSCNVDDWFDCMCSETEDETKSTIQNEKTVEQKPKNYVCNYSDCDSTFQTKQGLKQHTNFVHLKLRPFKCTGCEASFSQKCKLKKHNDSIHLKLRPFKCNECESLFTQKHVLQNHINLKHLKLKPFMCTNCPSSFTTKQDFRYHMNAVHLKIKPFNCKLCSYSSATGSNLNPHKKAVHLKLKPHKCTECSLTFFHKTGLQDHARTTKLDGPHSESLC